MTENNLRFCGQVTRKRHDVGVSNPSEYHEIQTDQIAPI